jgi:cell wall-associated NlpC family hydrolase
MATTRRAAVLCFSATLLISACLASSAFARPLLPPELPSIDAPAVNVSLTAEAPASADSAAGTASSASPRRLLADFALKLRNIAYVRGGRELTTGFDCSGFVRYVFQQSLGQDLPPNSTSQFESGNQVDRDALKMGDLVFFRTHGGRRVSHVGIYLDNGLFIHSPSRGKRVRIDHLDGSYWAKRFAGAKRPDVLT